MVYTFNAGISPLSAFLSISSNAGFNNGGTAGGGRSGAALEYLRVNHAGNGDAGAIYGSVIVSGNNAGATYFTGNPAGSLLFGQVIAGADKVYLEALGDINVEDKGFTDVTALPVVINLFRTTAPSGTWNAPWTGIQVQSADTMAIDSVFAGKGPSRIGLDLTKVQLQDYTATATNAAITTTAGMLWFGNATNAGSFSDTTVLGTENFGYSATNGWRAVVGSSQVFGATATAVTANVNLVTKGATADQSADVYVATSTDSRTIPNNVSWEALTPAGTIASFTTTMPAAPVDKQIVWISTTQTITTWTLSPNSGQTINGAPGTLLANTSVQYRYNLATTTWFRML